MNLPATETQPRPLRIFVVENHPDTLKYLRMYLETMGHEVFSAPTVAEALAALPASDCDVLLSDIGLPDGTGWELLQRLEGKLDRPVYAIAMSGFGLHADQSRSRAAGFRHHLVKPFPPDRLGDLMDEAASELATEAVGHER